MSADKCQYCGAPKCVHTPFWFECGTHEIGDQSMACKERLAHAETRKKLEGAEKRIQQLGELPIGEFIEKDGEITLEVMVEAFRFNAYAEDLAGAILPEPKKGGAS